MVVRVVPVARRARAVRPEPPARVSVAQGPRARLVSMATAARAVPVVRDGIRTTSVQMPASVGWVVLAVRPLVATVVSVARVVLVAMVRRVRTHRPVWRRLLVRTAASVVLVVPVAQRLLVLLVEVEMVVPRVTAVKVDSASPSVINQTEQPVVTVVSVVLLVLEALPHRALLVVAVMVALAATVEAEDSRLVRVTVAMVVPVVTAASVAGVETRAVASTEVAATAAPPELAGLVRMPEFWCPVRTVVPAATEARRELAGIRVRSETVAVAARPARTALRHRVVPEVMAAPVRVPVLVA